MRICFDPCDENFREGLSFLSAEKKLQLGRLAIQGDRARLVWGDLLLRKIIASRTGQPPGDIVFSCREYGKPVIRDQENIHFNLSHSGDCVAAVLSDHETGVDVEEINPGCITDELAGTFMSEQEFQIFSRVKVGERVPLFFRIWTAKESFIKTTGEGFSADLKSISMDFGEPGISVRKNNKEVDGYYFREYFHVPGYSMTACSRGSPEFSDPKESLFTARALLP